METNTGRTHRTNQNRDQSSRYNSYNANYHNTRGHNPFDPSQRQSLSQSVGRQSVVYPRNNGLPYVGDIISNEVPKLSAQNIPDSVNYYWRIAGFTDCSQTCGGGRYRIVI